MNNKTQAVSQQSAIELPTFNQVIEIKVEVNTIYNKLISEFPPEYKHKELVTHSIIGSIINTGDISYLYNAMNGYSPAIDFQVGDIILCQSINKTVRYDANIYDAEGKQILMVELDVEGRLPNWKYRKVMIDRCNVVAINLYNNEKLCVEFEQDSRYDKKKEITTEWVDHKQCTKWVANY